MRDQVYSKPQTHIVDFAFNDAVADVFPDMIRRSVPGYETIIPMTGLIAARHLGDSGRALDLGCSLGATTQAILAQTDAPGVQITGFDNSAPMIKRALAINQDSRAEFLVADIQDQTVTTKATGAKVVLLNFVLQFVEPTTRLTCLTKIREAISDTGMLIISEKVKHKDALTHDFYDQTHLAWKQANGYSELEVSQKRTSLEEVMRVDTTETHIERLAQAGFTQVTQWYQCMNWASFIAMP